MSKHFLFLESPISAVSGFCLKHEAAGRHLYLFAFWWVLGTFSLLFHLFSSLKWTCHIIVSLTCNMNVALKLLVRSEGWKQHFRALIFKNFWLDAGLFTTKGLPCLHRSLTAWRRQNNIHCFSDWSLGGPNNLQLFLEPEWALSQKWAIESEAMRAKGITVLVRSN